MPRVAIPVTQIVRSGTTPATETNGDATNGHTIANNGMVWLEVRNSGTTVPRIVSAQFAHTVDGVTIDAKTWSIPTSASRRIGPFPTRLYGTTLLIDVDNAELKLSAYALAQA